MWEHFLNNLSDPNVKADFDRVVKILEDSKSDLISTGYDDIAIDDFYTTFRDQFKLIEEASVKS